MGYFRVGYYEQWDLTDNGLPGEELRGSLRSIYYKGIRRKGFGKEQRVYWAQVGWALISPLIEHGMFYFQQISIFISFALMQSSITKSNVINQIQSTDLSQC